MAPASVKYSLFILVCVFLTGPASAESWVKVQKPDPALLSRLTKLVGEQHPGVKDPTVTTVYVTENSSCPAQDDCSIDESGVCVCPMPDNGECPGATRPTGDGKWCTTPMEILGTRGPGMPETYRVLMR